MPNCDLALYIVRIFLLLSEKYQVRMDTEFLFCSTKVFLDSSYLSSTWILLYYLSSGGILILSNHSLIG